MKIQLSDHFTYKRLIRFVFPSIIMMICTSMYSIIDGLFISNFAGKTAICCGQSDPSCCDGCWSNWIYDRFWWKVRSLRKTLGEGQKSKKQMNTFSMLIFTALIGATILSIFGFSFYKADLYGTWGAWTAA